MLWRSFTSFPPRLQAPLSPLPPSPQQGRTHCNMLISRKNSGDSYQVRLILPLIKLDFNNFPCIYVQTLASFWRPVGYILKQIYWNIQLFKNSSISSDVPVDWKHKMPLKIFCLFFTLKILGQIQVMFIWGFKLLNCLPRGTIFFFQKSNYWFL